MSGGLRDFNGQLKSHLSAEVCLIAAHMPGYLAPVEMPFETMLIPPDLRRVGSWFRIQLAGRGWEVSRIEGPDRLKA